MIEARSVKCLTRLWTEAHCSGCSRSHSSSSDDCRSCAVYRATRTTLETVSAWITAMDLGDDRELDLRVLGVPGSPTKRAGAWSEVTDATSRIPQTFRSSPPTAPVFPFPHAHAVTLLSPTPRLHVLSWSIPKPHYACSCAHCLRAGARSQMPSIVAEL